MSHPRRRRLLTRSARRIVQQAIIVFAPIGLRGLFGRHPGSVRARHSGVLTRRNDAARASRLASAQSWHRGARYWVDGVQRGRLGPGQVGRRRGAVRRRSAGITTPDSRHHRLGGQRRSLTGRPGLRGRGRQRKTRRSSADVRGASSLEIRHAGHGSTAMRLRLVSVLRS